MCSYFLQCSYTTIQTAQDSTANQLIPLLCICGLLALYITAIFWLKQHNKPWNFWRTVSFMLGATLLAVAFSPFFIEAAHTDFSNHMLQHLLIGMFAPIAFALSAPITLALKILPRTAALKLSSALSSRFFHFISHPVTALFLNTGSMFLLYLTPLYRISLTNPYLHNLINIHFFLAGYLFTWSIIGLDPAPKRPKLKLRVAVLFISIAAHSFLSKLMYAHIYPRNTSFPDDQIKAAAKLMYYGGDLSELLMVIALFALWYKKQRLPRYQLNF